MPKSKKSTQYLCGHCGAEKRAPYGMCPTCHRFPTQRQQREIQTQADDLCVDCRAVGITDEEQRMAREIGAICVHRENPTEDIGERLRESAAQSAQFAQDHRVPQQFLRETEFTL